jgi:micrococcal nuclease
MPEFRQTCKPGTGGLTVEKEQDIVDCKAIRMRWIIAIVASFLFATTVAVAEDQLVEVTAIKLNVRASPSVEAPIVDQVKNGDHLFINPVSDRWAAISHEGKVSGYISTKYVKSVEQENDIHVSPVALLVGLLVIVFLIIAFRDRPNRTQPSYENSEARENKKEVTTPKHSNVEDYPPVKVEHVIDGDTVIVSSFWRKTKIRLDSIDCPEDGQEWGDIAKFGLIKMIGGRKVYLEEHGEDLHGRTLATIYVRQGHGSELMNVNARMVTLGHAWVMRKYYGHLPKERQTELNKLERWARSKKVGLWKNHNPTPPWMWRINNKCN